MQATALTRATTQDLQDLVAFGKSVDLYLTAFVGTEPSETTTEGARLRLLALLDDIEHNVADTPWERPFAQERRKVEDFIKSLRPGGPALVIATSTDADEERVYWLPTSVEDHARFGPGAYVLPILDLLDELEPIGVVVVARDEARIMTVSAGSIEDDGEVTSDIHGMHRDEGGFSQGYSRVLPGVHGGGGTSGMEGETRGRHIWQDVYQHFDEVVDELAKMHARHGFRRFFVAGPVETRTRFKEILPAALQRIVTGEFSPDSRASDIEIRDMAISQSADVERQEESDLVEDIVTRAKKEDRAVIGLSDTLWALNRGTVHRLAMVKKTDWDGRYCQNCDILLPPEDLLCPQCTLDIQDVRLWEEVPAYAIRRGAEVEIVHGDAASTLGRYDGLGATLRYATR